MNEARQETSLTLKLMFVFMSFETGHPVFAFIAMDWNVASSIPGIFDVNGSMLGRRFPRRPRI
jgi:hypothetical protein